MCCWNRLRRYIVLKMTTRMRRRVENDNSAASISSSSSMCWPKTASSVKLNHVGVCTASTCHWLETNTSRTPICVHSECEMRSSDQRPTSTLANTFELCAVVLNACSGWSWAFGFNHTKHRYEQTNRRWPDIRTDGWTNFGSYIVLTFN